MFSLEVFPPKRTSPVGTIYDTLDGLQGLDPDFISVTYGTGKSSDRTLTARIAHTVSEYGIPSVAHLTAQYLNKDDVDQALDMFSTDFAFMTGMMPASIGTSIPAALALSRNLRKSSLS